MVTEEENKDLIKISSLEEIKESIWQLHLLKSSGPYGFPAIFYRFYWRIVQNRIVWCVQEFFHYGRIEEDMNNSLIVLISKTDQPSTFDGFRPRSLYNFSYKVVAKIIAIRLGSVVSKIVSLN